MTTNKLVIFRVPADKEDRQFVQVKFANGELDSVGDYFYVVDETDSYMKLGFDQLVIADEIEGGSTNDHTFTLIDENDEPAVVYQLDKNEIQGLVQYMLDDIIKAATIQ